jgi:hypothetical protein
MPFHTLGEGEGEGEGDKLYFTFCRTFNETFSLRLP